MRNLWWIVATAAVVAGAGYVALNSAKSSKADAPQQVGMEIGTTVDITPDGKAHMVSRTKIGSPPLLTGLLQDLLSERGPWLQAKVADSIRDGLREQPWQTGEVLVDFEKGGPGVVVIKSDVTLYRYAWLERTQQELWYSPGIVTRQDQIAALVAMVRTFGQPVSSLNARSNAVAYWPKGSVITETLPLPGTYDGEAGGVRIDYRLDVFTDSDTLRPVVKSQFDITARDVSDLGHDLENAFDDLLRRAGVSTSSRTVYIRYRYPVPPGLQEGPEAMPGYRAPAPRRTAAITVLAGALAIFAAGTWAARWRRHRRRGIVEVTP